MSEAAAPVADDAATGAGDDAGTGSEADFDRAAVEADARELLGQTEDELQLDQMTRIVRRGDEYVAVTMDLVAGRRNVELDDDGSGTFVVTLVAVEVPDGQDPLVVE